MRRSCHGWTSFEPAIRGTVRNAIRNRLGTRISLFLIDLQVAGDLEQTLGVFVFIGWILLIPSAKVKPRRVLERRMGPVTIRGLPKNFAGFIPAN